MRIFLTVVFQNEFFIYIILLVAIITFIAAAIGITALNKNDEKDDRANTLVVGLDDSFPPYGYRDENNEIVGIDIDLAKAVAEKLGMSVKFQPISWASKEQEIESGNIDCIWNGFAYNEERAKIMTLSKKYLKGEMYFMLKNGSTIKSQDELAGKKIGVQSGSVQEADLEKSELGKQVEIVPYADFLTACMDLEIGGIDAVYSSSIYGNYIIESKNKDYITIPSYGISTASGSVIAFKLGNTELKEKVEEALEELEQEGKLEEISLKWFGTSMIKLQEE